MVKGIENIATKEDFIQLKNELNEKLGRGLIKWIFFFGITQIIATSLIFILLLKK
jgi:hypothetical protein